MSHGISPTGKPQGPPRTYKPGSIEYTSSPNSNTKETTDNTIDGNAYNTAAIARMRFAAIAALDAKTNSNNVNKPQPSPNQGSKHSSSVTAKPPSQPTPPSLASTLKSNALLTKAVVNAKEFKEMKEHEARAKATETKEQDSKAESTESPSVVGVPKTANKPKPPPKPTSQIRIEAEKAGDEILSKDVAGTSLITIIPIQPIDPVVHRAQDTKVDLATQSTESRAQAFPHKEISASVDTEKSSSIPTTTQGISLPVFPNSSNTRRSAQRPKPPPLRPLSPKSLQSPTSNSAPSSASSRGSSISVSIVLPEIEKHPSNEVVTPRGRSRSEGGRKIPPPPPLRKSPGASALPSVSELKTTSMTNLGPVQLEPMDLSTIHGDSPPILVDENRMLESSPSRDSSVDETQLNHTVERTGAQGRRGRLNYSFRTTPTKLQHIVEVLKQEGVLENDASSPSWNPHTSNASTEIGTKIKDTSSPSSNYLEDDDMSKRQRIALELLETEKSYVDHLKNLEEFYVNPLNKACQSPETKILSKEEIKLLFSNISVICGLNQKLLNELKQKLEDEPWNEDTTTIGDLFVKFAHFLKMYKQYVSHHDQAEEWLHDLYSNSSKKKFKKFCEQIDSRTRGHSLRSYLIMPIQRIPRYRLLLEQLKKNTLENHPDSKFLSQALQLVSDVATDINEFAKIQEKQDVLITLQSKFLNSISLVKPGRKLIKDGALLKKRNQFYFFLFDDLLVISRKVFSGFVLQEQHELYKDEFDAQSIPEDKSNQLFLIEFPTRTLKLQAYSLEEKEEWIKAINDLKSRAKLRPVDDAQHLSGDSKGVVKESKCQICGSSFSLLSRSRTCYVCKTQVCGNCGNVKLSQEKLDEVMSSTSAEPSTRPNSELGKPGNSVKSVCTDCISKFKLESENLPELDDEKELESTEEEDNKDESIQEEEDTSLVRRGSASESFSTPIMYGAKRSQRTNLAITPKSDQTRSGFPTQMVTKQSMDKPTNSLRGKLPLVKIRHRRSSSEAIRVSRLDSSLQAPEEPSVSQNISSAESSPDLIRLKSNSEDQKNVPEIPQRPMLFKKSLDHPTLPSKDPISKWKREKSGTSAPDLSSKVPFLFVATALYSYAAQSESEINLTEGQSVYVTSRFEEKNGWWEGFVDESQQGFFPVDYVLSDVRSDTSTTVRCIALGNCKSLLPGFDSVTDPTLFFNSGDVIEITVEDGEYAYGTNTISGKEGWFLRNLVKVLQFR